MIGIAPSNFNLNEPKYEDFGWHFYCKTATLFSGPPHKFYNKISDLNIPKDEITIIVNMDNGSLKYIIDGDYNNNNNNNKLSYINIPLNKPLTLVVFLYDNNDSIQITKY